MAEEIPVIPKVENLLIKSGNIVNWNRLKRKPNRSPTEELLECMSAGLSNKIDSTDKDELQYATDLKCVPAKKEEERISEEERGDLKISVKIFLFRLEPAKVHVLYDAVLEALKELETGFLETVLLALPELDDDEPLTLHMIQPYWIALEELVAKSKVLTIGIADLDKDMLEKLYDWAQVKPVADQVNLESCCVMPKDLTEYAKQNAIQLLTHNDPKNIMPDKTLQEAVAEKTTQRDSEKWEMAWAVRYSVVIKCRGIIKMKGYITQSTKDTKRR